MVGRDDTLACELEILGIFPSIVGYLGRASLVMIKSQHILGDERTRLRRASDSHFYASGK